MTMLTSRREIGAGRGGASSRLFAGPALLVMALLLGGCAGGEAERTAEPASPSTSETLATPPAAPSPLASADPAPTAEPTPAPGGTGLPGKEAVGPQTGDTLAVIGVAADDTLNVRDVPGTAGDVVGELDPLADDIEVTGRARTVDGSQWWEIEGGAVEDAWVNARYLAWLGETTDITSELEERPGAATLDELARIVADLRAASSEGDAPQVVVSDGPTVGDLGEVTVDLVGFADDAIRGERLHVFAVVDEGDARFTLRTVERTLLCSRGTSDGLCT